MKSRVSPVVTPSEKENGSVQHFVGHEYAVTPFSDM